MSYQANDLLFGLYLSATGKGGPLMLAGIAAQPVETIACNTYHVVVETLNGTDVLQVQGQIIDSGWVSIGSAISANGEATFTGLWDKIRVSKTSGSGTTTKAWLRAGRV